MHRKHSPELKVRVALEAIKGQLTTSEIGSRFEVHPSQVSQWKRQALDALPAAFGRDGSRTEREQEEMTSSLYQEIGRLKVELDWLQKKGRAIIRSEAGADRARQSGYYRPAAVRAVGD